jgi:dTDP-4-dehydrorhamnose reductase
MIAEATAVAVGRAEPPEGLFHLTAAGNTSWFGFAAAIVTGTAASRARQPNLKPIPSSEYPVPAARPANSRLSCARLASAAGIALPDWQRMVELCLADKPEAR